MLLDFDRRGRAAVRHRRHWIRDLGIRYQLGVDGLNLWLVALTTLLFAVAALWLVLRPPARASRCSRFHWARRDRRARALPRAGPVLFVLFFDLMLVPFYFLVGHWGGPDRVAATFKLVVYTLVGSLLMLARGRGDRRAAARGPAAVSFVVRRAAPQPAVEEHAGVDLRRLRARVPDQDAGVPVPRLDARRLPHMPLPALAVFSGVLSKVAAYGFLRVALPLFPTPSRTSRHRSAASRCASILYGSVAGLHADQHAADPRLLVDGPARLHHARHLRAGPDRRRAGRLLQSVNHGLVVAPLFFIIALLDERSAARRTSATWAGSRSARRARGAVPDRRARDAGDARLGQLRRRVPDPARRVQPKLVDRAHRLTGVVLASVYMLRLYIRAMHNRRRRR
jgi:NADH-quinone oxidoreductase subunit M